MIEYLSVFGIAFFAALSHCVGMCGGLIVAYSSSKLAHTSHSKAVLAHLLYIFGRIFTYMILGGMIGWSGSIFEQNALTKAVMLITVNIFLLIFGLAFLITPKFARKLELRLDSHSCLFACVSKAFNALLRSQSLASFLLLGMLNGILPCGIVYYFLLTALATQSALEGALVMGVFGVGTLVVMLPFSFFTSLFMQSFRHRQKIFRMLCGICMIGFSAFNLSKFL